MSPSGPVNRSRGRPSTMPRFFLNSSRASYWQRYGFGPLRLALRRCTNRKPRTLGPCPLPSVATHSTQPASRSETSSPQLSQRQPNRMDFSMRTTITNTRFSSENSSKSPLGLIHGSILMRRTQGPPTVGDSPSSVVSGRNRENPAPLRVVHLDQRYGPNRLAHSESTTVDFQEWTCLSSARVRLPSDFSGPT